MTKPKVSVIIPVYNTEKYLEETFLSILNQSLRDTEIVVINDGSTDGSQEIINRLASNDSRIHCFSQSNKGLSEARNRGMENASGEYLYFMDSDDILDTNTLELCYNKCAEENLDIVIFDAEIFFDDNKPVEWGYNYYRAGMIDEKKIYEGTEILEALLDKNLFRASPCLFFVKRELPEKNNLRFYPGIIHEDELFTPLLYMGAEKVRYIPSTFFHRRVRENSIMIKKFSKKNATSYFIVVKELRAFAIGKDLLTQKIVRKLIENIVNSVAYRSYILTFRERMRVFKFIYKGGFFKLTSVKNLAILLFPFTISIKSKCKRFVTNLHN